MKAIVLGATGFIGSHVARALLSEGWDVRVLRRSIGPAKALEGLPVEEKIGDLSDLASLKRAFRGCEALFHAAGFFASFGAIAKRSRVRKAADTRP